MVRGGKEERIPIESKVKDTRREGQGEEKSVANNITGEKRKRKKEKKKGARWNQKVGQVGQ